MALIYIVEDDTNIREIERYALKNSGFDVEDFETGKELYKAIDSHIPNLILLDIMLPDEDGLDILKRLRSNEGTMKVPIIMLTAKSSEIDKVKGLDLGADDYMTKPFGVMELISRVKALLRRVDSIKEEKLITCQNIVLDVEKRSVRSNDMECLLTYKEFELLKLLMINQGIVLSREKIMDQVWGFDYEGESRTVDMHIKTLRQKLGDTGVMIKTIRNVGYVFNKI